MKKWISMMMSTVLALSLLSGTAFADGEQTKVIQPKTLPTIGRAAEQQGAMIIFRESEKDSWSKDEEFVFTLPEGVSWDHGTKVNGIDGFIRDRKLTVYFHGTAELDQIALIPVLNIKRNVPVGNIDISVERGPVSAQYGRVSIAVVSDHGLLLNATEVKDIIYGDKKPQTIKVKLEEMIDDSLIRAMAYEMTLENAKFVKKTEPVVREVLGIKTLETKFADDSLVLSSMEQAKKTSWEISFDILPEEGYTGDITLQLKGREAEQKILIASVKKDLEVEMAEAQTVSLGYKDQKVADVKITEAMPGALAKGSYLFRLEPMHKGNMIESAEVEVTEGNIKISNVRIQDNEISFDVTRDSVRESVIMLKNVEMTMGTGSFLGEYKLSFLRRGKTKEDEVKFADFVWFNATAPTEDPALPAPARVAQFVIGQKDYDLFLKGQKETQTFDVAPYIESGRTMMSVKAVADALDMDVEYEAETKTVTITSKDATPRVMKLKIGEKMLVVGDNPVPLDVAPVIKDGRTFVPVSYISKFFDAETKWDGKLRMVTVTLP